MGSIQVEEFLDQGQPNGDSSMSLKIVGLTPDRPTATGLREEIILLSWYIALLRTSEGSQIIYEWAYGSRGGGRPTELVKRRLAIDELKIGLQSSIGEAAIAISSHLATITSREHESTGPASLLLSTGSLSQTSESKDEVSWAREWSDYLANR